MKTIENIKFAFNFSKGKAQFILLRISKIKAMLPFTLNSIIPFFVCLSVLFFLIYVIYLQNLQIVDLQTQINLLKLNLAGVAITEKRFFYIKTGLMLFSFVIGIILGGR